MPRNRLIAIAMLALGAACTENTFDPADVQIDPPSLANVHLKGGANAEPSFTDLGLALRAIGALSGLGNGDIFIFMSATANATATCGNPGATQFQAPGQNPAPVTVSGGQFIPSEDIDKNGNVGFNVTTAEPPNNPRPAAAGECPNTQWTYTITDLSFTSAIIQVYQPSSGDPANPGPLVLTVTCTFSQPTANGSVPGTRVSCTQS